jgi:undecaprenyl-diphosphatase
VSTLAAAFDAIDRRVHGRLVDRRFPRSLGALLRTCSALGDGWLWLIGAAALLAAARPLAELTLAAAMAAAVNLPVVVLKTLVRRPRPGAYERNPFLDVAIGGPPACDVYSFPSGHAANAVALAVVLSHAFRPVTALAFTGALLIGTSRVLLGHHYLTDLIAGVMVGLIAAAALTGVPAFAF